MTEKRFERIYADVNVFCRDHNAKGLSQLIEKEDYDTIVDLLNDLNDEVMDLRAENTRFKLVVSDVVEDLEKQAKSKEPIILSEKYVDWIKENVNLKFHYKKELEE